LSARARAAIHDTASHKFVSHASLWEITIKAAPGKLRLFEPWGRNTAPDRAARAPHGTAIHRCASGETLRASPPPACSLPQHPHASTGSQSPRRPVLKPCCCSRELGAQLRGVALQSCAIWHRRFVSPPRETGNSAGCRSLPANNQPAPRARGRCSRWIRCASGRSTAARRSTSGTVRASPAW